MNRAIPDHDLHEAAHRFGSDKPDLRVKLEFTELTDVMKDVDFKGSLAPRTKGAAWWPCACRWLGPGGGISRGEIDTYTEFVKIYGAKGLAWIRSTSGQGPVGLQSPIVKNLHDAGAGRHPEAHWRAGWRPAVLRCRQGKIVNDAIGALRIKISHSEFGKKNGLFENRWAPLWVVDFPMFEHDEEETAGRLYTIPSPAPRMATKTSWTPILAVPCQGLRHGAQRRLGAGRRFGAYPPC